MLLKELQIKGFKSFLNNTIMKFPKGITAIVGPNGSGKSNISDAIRWVLGESSVKSLRGNKMEDIIFTGTEDIKPVSFAEVSITFSECKIKDLPYDEVVVTRRIFRDGNSEYFINKNKVRLRDIRELFMDTGIGRDGYSLIGQGQIDSVLSNKPEDRRDIFEEASGISAFKYKKDEALRKIERSNDDLDRLSDIFDEINKQYDHLEAESKKTKKYNEVILEKNMIELDLLYYNVKKAVADLEVIIEEKTLLNHDKEKNKAEIVESENIINDFNLEIKKIEEKIDEMNNLKMLKYKDFSELKSTYKILSERKNHLETSISGLENELENKSEEKKSIADENRELESSLDSFIVKDSSQIQDNLVELRELFKKTQEEIEEIKDYEYKNNILKAELEADKKIKAEKVKFYNLEYDKIKGEILKIDNYLNSLVPEKEKNDLEKEMIVSEYNKVKFALDLKFKEKTSLKDKINELNNRLSDIKSRNKNLELSLNFNKNILDTNELLYQPIKFLAKKYKQEDGYLGTVVSMIDTDREFVKAIETALGSRMQFVFADKVEHAKKMISDLNHHKAGRATFLPLDTTNKSEIQIMKNKPDGVRGFAIEFIKAKEPFRSIIAYLLRDIVIVDNIDVGVKFQKKYKMIVTINGEQLNQYGAITGGTSFKERETPLSIRAKIEDLKKSLALGQKDIDAIHDEILNYEKKLFEFEDIINELNEDLIQLEAKNLDLDNRLSKLENDIKESRQNLDSKMKSRDDIMRQLEMYSADKDEVKVVDIDSLKLNSLIEERNKLSKRIEELEGLRQESVDNILRKSNIEFKIDSNNKRTIEIDSIKIDLENQIKQLNVDLSKLNIELNESIVKLAEIEDLQKQDDEAIIEIQNERSKIKSNLAEVERLIREKREKEQIIDGKINQQLLREARLDESLSNYKIAISDMGYEFKEFLEIERDTKNLKAKKDRVAEIDSIITRLGMINLNAINEFKELSDRRAFYELQISDIQKTISDLNSIIAKINQEMKVQFRDSMVKIRENFIVVFKKLFNGGEADLYLVDEADPLNSGITIVAKPPGKKLQSLSLLSGGEKTLTAMALLFAILELKPAPFCILDEIDAALDDINIARYTKFLRELSRDSQFLIITHRKTSLEVADTIYGVCMKKRGVSDIISVRVEDYIEEVS